MTIHDLTFTESNRTIYDPLELAPGSPKTIRITNYGEGDLAGLGLFIRPATSVGDVDDPADYPPETDYQDLLTWGQATALGLDVKGGLKVTYPAGNIEYITRSQGSKKADKIELFDLDGEVDASNEFIIELEYPSGYPGARRLFIDVVVE
jgi:hypothetical protein